LKNREEAKERLLNLIQISPYKFGIDTSDVYLYPNRAILNLHLAPLTEYSISLASFETDNLGQTEKKSFTFTTPENKYFGLKILDPLTLYTKNNLPIFQVVDYNTEKIKTIIQICPISVEDYAKVEVYLKTANKEEANEFFKTGILTCNKET
jgi:hypothetical protein